MTPSTSGLRDALEKLSARERRLATMFLAVLLGFALVLVPIGAAAMLSSRRDANKSLRDAIFAVKSGRDQVQARRARRDAIAARYATKAPPLAGLLEKTAKDQKLDIPESQDRPDVPSGKRFVERSTVVRLRKAGMLAIANMLEALEQKRMPLAVTRLSIRRRGGEHDAYDVELGVSAWDKVEAAGGAKGAAAPADSAGGGK